MAGDGFWMGRQHPVWLRNSYTDEGKSMKVLQVAVAGTAAVTAPLVVSPVVNAVTLGPSWVRVDAVDNGDETVTLRIGNLDRENPISCAASLTDLEVDEGVRSDYISLRAELAPGRSATKTRGTVPGHYRVEVRCDGRIWRYLVTPGSLFTVSPRIGASVRELDRGARSAAQPE